jgi:hypothetical protein
MARRDDLRRLVRRIDRDVENQGTWHTVRLDDFSRRLSARLAGLQFSFGRPSGPTDFAFVIISGADGEWGELTVGRDMADPERPVYSFNGSRWLDIDDYFEFYIVDEFLEHLARMR